MSEAFMHIGKFVIRPESRSEFIDVMKEYEQSAQQNGLRHSNVIEDENTSGTFMHVTLWESRADWVAVEQTTAHKNMHEKRSALLAAPMEHDFVCGKVQI
ncbi:MAG: antibiotic biosynthesis monooxygenase family protein [Pseudomonadota bacterium]